VDLGDDWEDPLREVDLVSDLRPLSYFSVRGVPAEDAEEVGSGLQRLASLASQEWVEALEQVTTSYYLFDLNLKLLSL
jgi:hypothetical protein